MSFFWWGKEPKNRLAQYLWLLCRILTHYTKKKTTADQAVYFLMKRMTVRRFNLETHEEFDHLLHGGRWQEVGGNRTFKEGKEGWPGKTPLLLGDTRTIF